MVFIFISNCRVNTDDVTLVQPISKGFTNRRLNLYRLCAICDSKTDVLFLKTKC